MSACRRSGSLKRGCRPRTAAYDVTQHVTWRGIDRDALGWRSPHPPTLSPAGRRQWRRAAVRHCRRAADEDLQTPHHSRQEAVRHFHSTPKQTFVGVRVLFLACVRHCGGFRMWDCVKAEKVLSHGFQLDVYWTAMSACPD